MSYRKLSLVVSGIAGPLGLSLIFGAAPARAEETEAADGASSPAETTPEATEPSAEATDTPAPVPVAATPAEEEGVDGGEVVSSTASAAQINAAPAATADAVPSPPSEPPAEPEKKESSWTDHIKLKGDFRYRFEIIDTESTKLRYRHRIRARVGVLATVVDDVEIGVQMATGSADPVSTNQTLDEAFSTKPLWLDLGYVAYHPSQAEGLELVAGKMKNPFFCVGKSELIWDPDLTPEGIALGYRNGFGIAEPFIQTGGFFVEERSSERDSWILGVQGGLKLTFLDGLFHVVGGAGYIDHTHIQGREVYFDETDNMGNSAELASPDDYDPDGDDPALVYQYDYNLVEGFLGIGGKAGRFPWEVFGTVVANTAVENDNFGWLVGGKFGEVKEALDFDLRYIYRQVDKDAVVGLFTDSDFVNGGTGGTGHEWNLGFGLAKHVKLAATYFLNERPLDDHVDIPGSRPESGTETFHRFQLDFKFKF